MEKDTGLEKRGGGGILTGTGLGTGNPSGTLGRLALEGRAGRGLSCSFRLSWKALWSASNAAMVSGELVG